MRIRFPLKGLHLGAATTQPPEGTTFDCLNVRPFDSLKGRARGGQRPALVKWGNGDQVGGTEQPVVAMCVVGTTST